MSGYNDITLEERARDMAFDRLFKINKILGVKEGEK